MPQPTSYGANLTFGGKVDSSLDKAVSQIKKDLQSIQKDAALFSENIAAIGAGLLAVGSALPYFLTCSLALPVFPAASVILEPVTLTARVCVPVLVLFVFQLVDALVPLTVTVFRTVLST